MEASCLAFLTNYLTSHPLVDLRDLVGADFQNALDIRHGRPRTSWVPCPLT